MLRIAGRSSHRGPQLIEKGPFYFALTLRLGGLTHRLSFVTVGPLHAPWKMDFSFYRRVEKNVRLLEHECQWFKSEEKYKNATPFKPPSLPERVDSHDA